jgi:methylmalonyl-CoA/ethylmalonyl-CoA epimerase
MIGKIGQIALTVEDTERATAFYRDVVGLKHLFSAPPNLSFFDVGGTWIMLAPPEGEKQERFSSILYFDVEDIKSSYEELKRKGAKFRTEPHLVHKDGSNELWLADFYDTEGNTMCLRRWGSA